jgi:predicted MFS family arabinose efflux permease
MHSYGAILKVPALRQLLAASVPADLADWLDYVAIIALVVYGWQQGPFALALITAAISIPALIVGPFTAVLVDRSDLRWALVLSNAGRALTTACLIFVPNLWVLLPVVFLRGCIDSAFTPARAAALQALTPPELNAPANGLVFAINQTSKIAGPAIGGAILALTSPHLVFALNTALSLLAALILLFIRIPPRGPVESHSILAEAPQGFAEFFRNRRLLTVLVFMVFAWGFVFLYDALIALLVKDLGLDEAVFGYVIASSGLGGVIGALLAGVVKMRRDLPWMGLGALIGGPFTILVGAWALFGYLPPAWLYLGITLIKGIAVGFMLVPYRATIQREAPADRIARVFAAAEAIVIVVVTLSPFLGSLVANAFGVGMTFVIGGAGLIALGLCALGVGLRQTPYTSPTLL